MKKKRTFLAVFIVFLLVASLVGAVVLVRQNQEMRKAAASGWCHVYDDGFDILEDDLVAECGNDQPGQPPNVFYCDGQKPAGCGVGNCEFCAPGSGDCTSHPDLEKGEVRVGNEDFWCKTVQADSVVDGKFLVIYIGDQGEWWVHSSYPNEHTGKHSPGLEYEDDLDWDCEQGPTETPTPTSTPPTDDVDCTFTCTDIYAIDDDGNEIQDSEMQELEPQEVCFEVEGWTDCEQSIDEAKFQVIGWEDWEEGDFNREEDNPGGNGRFYYYRWCHDFIDITDSCYDIDAQVCLEGDCR
jgi:hypothetical protein